MLSCWALALQEYVNTRRVHRMEMRMLFHVAVIPLILSPCQLLTIVL